MTLTGSTTSDKTGGWTILQLSLEDFYKEHQIYRNLWSTSNCGFDLAKYHGTWMTAYPTMQTDYIIWWDTDYGQLGEFKTLAKHIHPAILINRKNTVLVLSKYTRGFYKPKSFWIPPPSVYDNRWAQQSEWSGRGLAIIAISTIDLRNPWLHPGAKLSGWTAPYDMNDWESKTTMQLKKVIAKDNAIDFANFWWMQNETGQTGTATVWATHWPAWGADQMMGPLDAKIYTAVAFGPFVIKDQRQECQITLTYRSRWTWGGDILTKDETVCNPKTGVPKMLRHAEPVDPACYITKADIGKDGFINPDVWARLVAEPAEHRGLSTFRADIPGGEQKEEETDDTLQEETEEEDEDTSSEGSQSPRGGVDRRRIRHLRFLQRLLKKTPNKSWSV